MWGGGGCWMFVKIHLSVKLEGMPSVIAAANDYKLS